MRRSVITDRLGWFVVPVFALVAACGTSSIATTTPTPTSQPTPTPHISPVPPADGMRVSLSNATANLVTVDITDGSGSLRAATSGTPGDGASVAPYTVVVANVDATTLRLTWTGGPCDAADSLFIDSTGRNILLVEPECPGDAIAFDRVLLLRMSSPVDAAVVHAVLQDGIDTQG